MSRKIFVSTERLELKNILNTGVTPGRLTVYVCNFESDRNVDAHPIFDFVIFLQKEKTRCTFRKR